MSSFEDSSDYDSSVSSRSAPYDDRRSDDEKDAGRKKAEQFITKVTGAPPHVKPQVERKLSARVQGAISKARDKLLAELIYDDMKARLDSGDMSVLDVHKKDTEFIEEVFDRKMLSIEMKKTAAGALGTWITISPPDVEPEVLLEQLLEFLCWLEHNDVHGYWSIEQRGDDPDNPVGAHVHILLPKAKMVKKDQLQPEVCGTFWGKRTHKPLPQQFYVKWTKTEADNDRVIRYLSGDKDEDKLSKIPADNAMRAKLGVQAINEF